jgi:hypothetical protein
MLPGLTASDLASRQVPFAGPLEHCMDALTHQSIETNGIRLRVAIQGDGPLVLLCHGFPETSHSWQHQMQALAAAGYRAVPCRSTRCLNPKPVKNGALGLRQPAS